MKKFIILGVAILGVIIIRPGTIYAIDKPILQIESGGHMGTIRDLIFTGGSKYLISAGDDKVVRVWNVNTGECVRIIREQIGKGEKGKIYAAALSPDEKYLAVGGYPYTGVGGDSIRLFKYQTGKIVKLFKGHTNVILDLAFSGDGKYIVSGSLDDDARIWSVTTGKCLNILKGHTNDIQGVDWSLDNSKVVTASFDKTLRLWDTKNGNCIKVMKGHQAEVRHAAYSPDGKYIVSCSYDQTVRLWNGNNGRFIRELKTEYSGEVTAVAFSPDSKKILITGYSPYNLYTYTIPYFKKELTFTKHDNLVIAITYSPDGTYIASGGGNNEDIYIWDANTGKVVKHLVGKGKSVWSTGISQDGTIIGWGNTYARADKYIIKGPLEHSFSLSDMQLGNDIKNDSGWIRAKDEIDKWTLKKVGKNKLEIINNGQTFRTIEIPRPYNGIKCYSFTPDKKKVIIGASWGSLYLYDVSTGKQIGDDKWNGHFIGHTGEVWSVAVSRDGQYLVSGSGDQTVKYWNIQTGECLLTLFRGTDREWVMWTPAGYYTSSVSGDKYIGWHINKGEDKAAEYYYAYQFKNQFYRPDIVKLVPALSNIKDAIYEANSTKKHKPEKIITIEEDFNKIVPPVVIITKPDEPGITTTEKKIHFKAVVRSTTDEPITRVEVLLNGRPIKGHKGIAIVSKPKLYGKGSKIDVYIPLEPGDNIISVIAGNKYAVSQPEKVTVRYETTSYLKPNLYVLAIGVSDYLNDNYDLQYAAKDVTDLVKCLGKQEGFLYNRVVSRELTDKRATKENILGGLEWILGETTQRDVALIFLSGHGIKDARDNYYFFPYDGNAKKLLFTGVKWTDFTDILGSLPSKVIFIVDTCHSGGVMGKKYATRGGSDITSAIKELSSAENGVVVMAASTGKELSRESEEWGNGAFTKALIEGLSGKADYNQDKTVELNEIDLYITQRVKKLTDGQQHPTTAKPQTIQSFPVIYLK